MEIFNYSKKKIKLQVSTEDYNKKLKSFAELYNSIYDRKKSNTNDTKI